MDTVPSGAQPRDDAAARVEEALSCAVEDKVLLEADLPRGAEGRRVSRGRRCLTVVWRACHVANGKGGGVLL